MTKSQGKSGTIDVKALLREDEEFLRAAGADGAVALFGRIRAWNYSAESARSAVCC